MSINQEQKNRIATGQGFIAALDQSGGSTPKALKLYGIDESEYSGDAEMFALVHAMRARIVTSPAFTGERVLGAILFERTLDDSFAGQEAAHYLWQAKGVVPFLKIDKGLEDEADGVQRLKPIPGLADLTAGLFYFHEWNKSDFTTVFRLPSGAPFIDADRIIFNTTDSFAIYGQLDWHLTDKLTLTTGGRWTSWTTTR